MKDKLKKIFGKSYVRNYLYLVISLFLIEIIFKLISGSEIISISTLRIFVILNLFSIIFTFILNYTGKILTKVIMSIIVFASSTYACVQCGFYNFLGVYGSVQASSQLGAVVDYIKDFVKSFKWNYFLTYIPFVLLLIVLIFIDKKAKNKVNLKHNFIMLTSILITCSLLVYGSISIKSLQNKLQPVSNEKLFLTASNPSLTIENYGVLGFLTLDVRSALFPIEVEEEYQLVNTNTTKASVNENTRIIDDSTWNSLIKSESNEEMNAINKYLISRNITDKNDYTGMFEGKNLIVIMMESVDDIFLNADYYPNFNKLVSNGWYWENNYSPRNSCATMNNEFSGMTSLYSIYNTCTASKYKTNEYYESIFNLFNRTDNYVTFSAHDYTEAYYPRSTIHANMGSGEYYGVQKLGIKYSNEYRNWANDTDFMEQVLNIIDNKTSNGENFMTWLTTVSSHQPYGVDSIQGNKYYDMTKNTGYPTDVRRYMSKLKILDNALGILLDGLESRGILDDTVIVLYGDHYPYGIPTKNLNKVLDYDTSEYLNAERVPLVMYNPSMESKVFSNYTYYLNLLPTIANLFNLDYDPRLYLGTDLFSDDSESLVVFADGSWKNEKAFYDASKNKVTYFTSDEYTEEEIMKINTDIATKVNISNKIITKNYFKYLDTSLEKEEKKLEEQGTDVCLLDEIKEDVENNKTEEEATTTTKKRMTTTKKTTTTTKTTILTTKTTEAKVTNTTSTTTTVNTETNNN